MSKFSLADGGRWMSNNRTAAYEQGKKLRHMPVHFVSAGHLEGTIKERIPAAPESDSNSGAESVAASSPVSSTSTDNTHAMAHMVIRSPSPALSQASSSSDEVVFRGRGQPLAASTCPSQIRPNTDAPTSSSSTSYALDQPMTKQLASNSSAAVAAASSSENVHLKPSVKKDVLVKESVQCDIEAHPNAEGVVHDKFAKRRGGRAAWEGTTTPWEHKSKPNVGWLPVNDRPGLSAIASYQANSRNAAMDDYMQNMEEFGLVADFSSAPAFARREMDLDAGSHNDWESDHGSRDDDWNSDMLQDFGDLSTSSDSEETVVRILSKRERKSGLHYLCVFDGFSVDDASWLPSFSLQSSTDKQLIQAFESELLRREQIMGEITESSGSDTEDDDRNAEAEDDDDDDDEDEDEEEFDDETIARVLQKQEELGLGSDEVLLYAGDDFFQDRIDQHISFEGFGRANKKRQARVRGNRDPTFPSASAMADALAMDPYGGFDIMDTERPSLRQKKKGRRGQLPPELEDEDLNDQLQRAWAADRDKKRLKKAEREELRQQGLLGRKGKGSNLKVKYQGGIGMEDVVEEIREFLMGNMQSLSLPPMEASRRATIHQVAAFFNLTSRSRGDGHDRFTVLAKTTRTRMYTDDEFDIAIRKKGFQKRLQGSLSTRGGRSSKFTSIRSSNRVRPQTGYQDGETVGANAPELGPENKGHALLSKMGWSKGTGLGALDNKGILQPIAHTVKINKAGLQ